MKHLFTFSVIFLLSCVWLTAQPTTPTPISSFSEITGLQHPESVMMDGGFIYVSNIGNTPKPEAKDNDGYISKFTRTGQLVEQRFIRNLHAPKGMAIVKSVLYIADVDKVVGYSLVTKRPTMTISFEGLTTFLNDITVKDDTSLLISATDVGKIYKVNLATQKIGEYAKEIVLQGVNGLDYDAKSKTLYVCSMGTEGLPNGEIGKIVYGKAFRYERLGKDNGQFDGIKLYNDDLYYTDWRGDMGGALKKMSLMTKETTILLEGNSKGESGALEKKLMGTADFYLDAKAKIVYIPLMLGGKVITFNL